MLNKIKVKIKKNVEILALSFLVFTSIILTTYYNYNKKIIYDNYKNILNNIYLKKTVNHLFDSFEPKIKKVNHKVLEGETFDKILKLYSINPVEIEDIKKELSKKINLNNLSTNQKIEFTIDQSKNLIKEFSFKISNTEKIYLKKDFETDKFNQEILLTKLNKDIVYEENVITKSLYHAATKNKIPVGVIIEFARLYGFQVDFQRDIRKQDSFQIMYEVFVDEKNKVINFGNILFANLKLSGESYELYFFDKE